MSLAEVVELLREGRLRVSKVIYKKDDGYYVLVGGPEVPRDYEIIDVEPGRVVYQIGEGSRKAWRRGRGTYLRVPKSAGPKEGPVLVERLDERTLVVYLG